MTISSEPTSQLPAHLPPISDRQPNAARALVPMVLLALFVFSLVLVPIRSDNDCWWQVKSGQYIWQHGLPKYDVMNFAAEGDEWHNHEWLSQVLFYGAFRAGEAIGVGGWHVVLVFTAVVLWACYGILYVLAYRLSRDAWIALLIAALAAGVGRRTFHARPPVITNLMLAIELYLLIAVAEGWLRRGWLLAMIPLIALWTNLHGGWMAGGVVLGAFLLEHVYTRLHSRLPRLPFDVPPVFAGWGLLAVAAVGCLVATFANPYLGRLYLLPGRVMKETALVASLGELLPPDLYYTVDFLWILLGTLALALLTRVSRTRLAELLLFFFFAWQAFMHIRHLLLFGVMMVPLLSRLCGTAANGVRNAMAEWNATPRNSFLHSFLPGAFAFAYISWVIVNPREGGSLRALFARHVDARTYIQRNMEFFSGISYYRQAFPADVADFIELADLHGRMFNENNYAGYLIWRFAPEKHKVFSDSRFDIFGGRLWREEAIVIRGEEHGVRAIGADGKPVYASWREILDDYDIQWAISRDTYGLSSRFEEEGGWTRVAHWADGFEIWIRDTTANADMIERAKAMATVAKASP